MINKPVNMVSQFISSHPVKLLGDLDFNFPPGTHAIGRLDSNSEGLLLLTTNKKITRLLFSSTEKHIRIYLVRLNNILKVENLRKLREGVSIPVQKGQIYLTPPCDVMLIPQPGKIYSSVNEENEPGTGTWITIELTEGKFRQVRKMVAAIGHRCKRLIRISIEDMELDNLPPGEVKEIPEKIFFKKLHVRS